MRGGPSDPERPSAIWVQQTCWKLEGFGANKKLLNGSFCPCQFLVWWLGWVSKLVNYEKLNIAEAVLQAHKCTNMDERFGVEYFFGLRNSPEFRYSHLKQPTVALHGSSYRNIQTCRASHADLRSAMPEPAVVCRPLAAAATAVAADLPAPKDLGRAHLALQGEERRGDIISDGWLPYRVSGMF